MSAGRDTGSVTGGSSSAVLDGDGSPLGVCDGGSDDGAALDGAALDGPTLEGAALDGVLPSDGVEQPASSSAPTTSEGARTGALRVIARVSVGIVDPARGHGLPRHRERRVSHREPPESDVAAGTLERST
jgi:hypothetical protein